MRSWILKAVCAVLFAALSACATTADDTVELQSEHYRIETNVGQRFARVARQHMENMLLSYRRTLPQFDNAAEHRFHVKIFRTQEAYNRAVPDMVKGSSGVFMSHERMLAAYLGDRVPESVFRTLYHEGFHQYIYQAIGGHVPLWLNEGLAEYFAEGTWNGNGFTLGQVPLKRLHVLRQAIRRRDLVPLDKLVEMDSQEWTRNVRIDTSRASVQYAQAWSFVHFLLHGAGRGGGRRVSGYLEALSRGQDPDAAFREHFGGDMRGLQQAWMRYVLRLQPSAKSVCKRNLRLLVAIAEEVRDGSQELPAVDRLRHRLIESRALEWEVEGSYGSVFSSDERREASKLFVCGADQSRGKISYRRGPGSSLSQAYYCTNHPGIILRAFVEEETGKARVKVEERVVDTLEKSVRRALAASAR